MNRMMILALASSALALQSAAGDEIRRATIPEALAGTWGESPEQCAKKDKSNVLIEGAKYGDASGSCAVRWVVETPSSQGANYAVHALCTSALDQTKTQIVQTSRRLIRASGTSVANPCSLTPYSSPRCCHQKFRLENL